MNYEKTGMSSLFRKSGRKVKRWDLVEDAPFKEKFIDIDKDWGDIEVWRTIQTYSPKLTNGYFLNSVDMQKGVDGAEARPKPTDLHNAVRANAFHVSDDYRELYSSCLSRGVDSCELTVTNG